MSTANRAAITSTIVAETSAKTSDRTSTTPTMIQLQRPMSTAQSGAANPRSVTRPFDSSVTSPSRLQPTELPAMLTQRPRRKRLAQQDDT